MFIEFTNLRKAFFRKRALIALAGEIFVQGELLVYVSDVISHSRHARPLESRFPEVLSPSLSLSLCQHVRQKSLSNFDLPLFLQIGDRDPDSISGRFTWVKWQKLRNGECNVMGQEKY